MSTKTVYAVITDRIIQALETGTVPWRMPWRKIKPASFTTGANYRGINRFMLEVTHPPAEPGAFRREPLKAAGVGGRSRAALGAT